MLCELVRISSDRYRGHSAGATVTISGHVFLNMNYLKLVE